jgi:tRNA threonylcarbamoyladenosine biosynthesis protein TsaE
MRTHPKTPEETEELGARIARARPGPAEALGVLYLRGELGAGKTTYARGFAAALGVTGLVRSPTYTLLELYPAGALTLVHLDLYRVRTSAELDSLGLREWAAPGHLWLIEWPERAAGGLPAADLTVAFAVGESRHEIEVIPSSALGAVWLVELENAGTLRRS